MSATSEHHRIEALRRYDILDTPPDGAFDHVTAMAAKLFSAPIAIVSLVDTDRIWFKSHHGLDVAQIDRAPGLCASAILENKPYLVSDALRDPRTLANPLVAGAMGLRFYLGVPLRTHDGFNLGTLCVIDFEPRSVTEEQIVLLEGLAALVMDQMELRLSARRAISDLSTALQRAEMMGREIDHRVMNSLQFVSSMLDMQSRTATPEAAEQLELAAHRVSAVARVHRHFYLDATIETLCALEYLKRLCAELNTLLGSASLTCAGQPTPIATTKIMALGLIVNELVTNAAKRGATRIVVEIAPIDNGLSLSVCDDGPGLPAGFDPARQRGLGMRVIGGLLRQHGGALDFSQPSPDGGACFVATLWRGANPNMQSAAPSALPLIAGTAVG